MMLQDNQPGLNSSMNLELCNMMVRDTLTLTPLLTVACRATVHTGGSRQLLANLVVHTQVKDITEKSSDRQGQTVVQRSVVGKNYFIG